MTSGPVVQGASTPLALQATSVSVSLGGTEVLCGVDVAVTAGTVLGVLGPSGAGKSTLFGVLAGEITPASGRVLLGERDVTRSPLWERARGGLGYLPQTPSVLFDLSVKDNILTFERAAGAEPRPVAERAEVVGLRARLGVRARDLSGGERRRLELLRVFIGSPRVLLCDEPFAAGDAAHVQLLASLLRARADAGAAVLIADHRVQDALRICDEALLLSEGRVQTRGPAAGFREDPAARERLA